MVTVGCRRGHSLPELIVAVTFLGASLGAVGTTAAAAAGRTRGAVLQQQAVREAGALLDSLLEASPIEDGERQVGSVAFRWAAIASGATTRVEVTGTGPAGRELVRLEGQWFPAEEALPWEDAGAP